MRLQFLHYCLLFAGMFGLQSAVAQQFAGNYVPVTGRPDNLIVCGDSDVATYRLELGPGQPFAENILVTVELFEGVRAIGFDASTSSAGVSLVSLADPTRPVVSLPALIPTASGRLADFGLVLEARCSVLDTINNHDDQGGAVPLLLFDGLTVDYQNFLGLPGQEQLSIDPYLAAIAAPVFGLTDALPQALYRVGDQTTRTNVISNGSFRGYADTILYEVEQGPGISIEAIRVNGQAKAFAKTANALGDTVIQLQLFGNDFLANTNGLNPGNNDTRFDPEESLLVEEDLLVVSCDESRISMHRVYFGCDGSFCAVVDNQSEVLIGSGQPSLRIEKPALFPTADVGYCTPGEFTVNVLNLGRETDPGFGAAHDISISAVVADVQASLQSNGYTITQVVVAGVPIASPAAAMKLDTLAAFQADPDGIGVGLEDLDGDGAFDDLALLESFSITVLYEMDCSVLNADGLDVNCANDAFTTFQVFAYYDDACRNRLEGRDINLYSPRNVQDDFEQATQPDAFSEGPAFQVSLEFGRLVFNFDNNCAATPSLRVYVEVPTGITIDNATSSLSRENAASMPLRGVTYNPAGDMAILDFDPSGEAFLNGQYEVVLGFDADCTAPLGETIFPTRVAYYCGDCDCEHTWICEDIVGPWIHRTAPPCPITSLFPCPEGVQGTSFTADRTTLGFTDPGFTNPITAGAANTKVAIPADSVRIVIGGQVGDNLVDDSLGVILHYFTPNSRTDTSGLFLLGSGELTWNNGGVIETCRVGAIAHTLETDTTETWQRFDLGQCIRDNGWTLQPGDEVSFTGMFEVNPLGPILDSYEFVEDLRGGFFVNSNGVEALCDQFGDTFRVGKPLTTFKIPDNSEYPSGCDPNALEFQLIGVNRGYVDEFGFEYRRAAKLDSLVIEFDTAMFTAFDDISLELFVAEHPTEGSAYFPVPPLTDFADGRYVLQLDTLDYSPELVTSRSFNYSLRVNLTPNCSSIRSSSTDDAFYPFRAFPSYLDRYYARDISAGQRVEEVNDDLPFTMFYDEPAILELDLLTPAYQRIPDDLATVEIEICNRSAESRAGRGWVTFNDTSDLVVEQAFLMDDPLNPVALTVEPFANGHYVNLGTLERVNGLNGATQVCDLLRFTLRANGCTPEGLRFATGWACETTVPVGWTPAEDQACVDDRALVEVEPISPFLEADLIEEPGAPVDLCAPFSLEFQVNNAAAGTAYDVFSRFYLPEGLVYQTGTIEVEYPADDAADNFVPVVTDLVPADTTIEGYGWQLPDLAAVNAYLGANGLQGFDANNPTDSNRFVLRLTFETNCDYRSGSIVFFDAEGDEACGGATNSAATESSAIQIQGLVPDGTHSYTVGLDAASRISSSQAVSELEIFATNVGVNATDADDFLEFTLPVGYAYESGSTVGVLPTGFAPGEPVLSMRGGLTLLQWPLPVGMVPGESARIRFGVRPASLDCAENAQASIAAVRFMTAVCVSGPSTCRIPSDITQGGGVITQLPIGDLFLVTILTNSSSCESATTEVLDFELDLAPDGFALTGNDLTVGLYVDADADGTAGPGDRLIDQQAVPAPAGATSVAYRFSGSLPRTDLGALLLRVDSAGTTLCAPQHVRVPLTPLDNAGDLDEYTLCLTDGQTLNLGEVDCTTAADLLFTWTTVPAGQEGLLSNTTIANPVLQVTLPYAGPAVVDFVLTTERVGIGSTTDTARVNIVSGVVLGNMPPVAIDFGTSIVLTPDVQQGTGPFSYAWSPAIGLDDPIASQPVASPQATTTYTLTVTDNFGCSATQTQLVTVNNPVNPNPNVTDTTLCPDAAILLEVLGGDVAWTENPANPSTGGLDLLVGNQVTFDPLGTLGEYRFEANVSDPAFPGFDSTVQIRVVVSTVAPGCAPDCDFPTLVSEVTTDSRCDAATGTVTLSFASVLTSYVRRWVDATGDTIVVDSETLGPVAPGVYTYVAYEPLNAGCRYERTVYISGSDVEPVASTTTPADCGLANGTASLDAGSLSVQWPDGSTDADRNDLTSGLYRVALFDAANPACLRFLTVEVGEVGGLQLSVSVDAPATCGASDGSATLTVVGGSGNYDYSWAGNVATRTNLRGGRYLVEITDATTGCRGSISFVVPETTDEATLTIDAATGEQCPGAADGRIDFTVGGSGAALVANTYFINDRGDTTSNGALEAGTYCIVLADAADCVLGGTCVTLEEAPAIVVDLTPTDACGIDNGTITVAVRAGRMPLTYTLPDGSSTQNLILTGFGPGVQTIGIADVLGCAASGSVVIGQCPPCDYAPDAGDTTLAQTSCDGFAAVCIAGIADRQASIDIFVNDTAYTGRLTPCDYGRTRIAYVVGVLNFGVPYAVSWTVDGTEFAGQVASLNELVQFFQDNDPLGNWTYDSATLSVIGGQRESDYSTLSLQRLGSSLVNELPFNERIEPYGLAVELPPGFHRIVVLDGDLPCADTLYANVHCSPVDTMVVNVPIDSSSTFCLSTVDLIGDLISVVNDCPDSTFATYSTPLDSCITVSGNVIGSQTGCWITCDDLGICDTTIVVINIIPNGVLEFRDTILVDQGDQLCLTPADLGLTGTDLTIINTCPGSAGTSVDFFVNDATGCIEYDGLALGEEVACLTLCDANGSCVNATLTVTVVPNDKPIVFDTLFINQTKRFCFADPVNRQEITNDTDSLVEVSLAVSDSCFAYRGLQLGQDTLGVTAVDLNGASVEVCLVLTVIPYDGGVTTRPDSTCTAFNTPIRVNVLANDDVFGGVASFRIVEEPMSTTGTVVVNPDNTITFTPAQDVCSRTAVIVYEVCNPNDNGCSTETVQICIECEDITVFNAISPNGDGINEVFYVEKIEEFPNNTLQIFNRWGNLVYETTQYRNDWAGTFNGDPLPDGAYFYILTVRIEGTERVFRGYAELMR